MRRRQKLLPQPLSTFNMIPITNPPWSAWFTENSIVEVWLRYNQSRGSVVSKGVKLTLAGTYYKPIWKWYVCATWISEEAVPVPPPTHQDSTSITNLDLSPVAKGIFAYLPILSSRSGSLGMWMLDVRRRKGTARWHGHDVMVMGAVAIEFLLLMSNVQECP